MAKLTIDIGARIDKLKKGLASSSAAVRTWGKKFRSESAKNQQEIAKTTSIFGKFKNALNKPVGLGKISAGLAGIGAGLVAAVAKSVKLAAAFEQTKIAFNTMLGDSTKGSAMLDELIEFSKKTHFTPEQTLKAGKTLLAFGFEAKDVSKTLRVLGDVSAGTGKNLAELAVIFGQIKGAGRLMGQDLQQLISAGFNPLNIISQKTGKSMFELRKDMEKGLISFDQVSDAFSTATSEGGLFFNLMEKQSQSLSGKLSTLQGSIEQLAIGFGNVLMPIIKPLTEEMIGFAESADEIAQAEKNATREGTALKLVFAEWLNIVTSVGRAGFDFNSVLKTTEEQAAATAAEIAKATEEVRKLQAQQSKGSGNFTAPNEPNLQQLMELMEFAPGGELDKQVALDMAVIEAESNEALFKGAGVDRLRREKEQEDREKASFQKQLGVEKQDLADMQKRAGALQSSIGVAFQPGGKIQSRLAQIGGERTINVDRQIPQKQLDELMKLNKGIEFLTNRIENMESVFPSR
jgi:tape measure domain-containing protein